MIELFPAKSRDEILRCGSAVHHAHFRVLHYTVAPISVPLNYSWHVLHTRHKLEDKLQPVSCSSHSRKDYRPHFTCGGILYFLKHYKHTARCVNTVRMFANCVCALPHNQQTRHACAPSWPQRCSGNIRKRNLLSGYPTYLVTSMNYEYPCYAEREIPNVIFRMQINTRSHVTQN